MGRRISLTHREFELLAFLMSHPDKLFSREELIQGAWPKYSGTHRILDQFITQLRAKLAQHSVERPHIATVWGQGYCLSTGQCLCNQTTLTKAQ
jgi:DNA-binding response OmpR family regulator